MKKSKSIIIIGGGSIGTRHARNLIALNERIEFVEPSYSRAEMLKKEFGVAVYKTIPDKKILREKFKAAIISSPPAFHCNNSLICAEAGLHLLIEKPLSHTITGTNRLKQISQKKKIRILLGYNWKFHPSFLRMKHLLEHNTIGKIITFNVFAGQYLPDWHPYENYKKGYSASRKLGGGILLDSHELSYLSWFMGGIEKVISSVVINSKTLGIETEDLAILILKCRNSSIGPIHLDYLEHPYKRSYVFCGTKGNISWDFSQKCVSVYLKDKKKTITYPENPRYDLNQMYLDEAKHFLNVISGKSHPATSLDEGIHILKIIEQAKKKSESHNK